MGSDDVVMLAIGVVGLVAILVVSYLYLFRKGFLAPEKSSGGNDAATTGSTRRTRRSQRNRQTGLAAMEQSAGGGGGGGNVDAIETADAAAADSSGSGGDVDEEEGDDAVWNKKEMRKAEKLREKAELKQQREEMRQEETDRRDGKKAKYKKKEDEREAKRLAQEQADEESRLAQEKAANDELDKWKGMFVVENTGSNEDDVVEESQGQLQLFIDYVKGKKVIMLEELAAEFGLRTQEAINRLQALEQMGRVTGVFDDRGKFIYIAPHEMDAVAKFIRSKGRVTISALAVESNKLIDLNESKLPSSTSSSSTKHDDQEEEEKRNAM